MPRCPECNKFVSLDTDSDPQFSVDVDDVGVVTGSVDIVNACGECGTDLRGATLDVEADLSDQISAHREDHKDQKDEHDELQGVETTDESRSVDTKGKGRGMRTFYGAECTIKVVCKCGEEFTEDWKSHVAASAMDELV